MFWQARTRAVTSLVAVGLFRFAHARYVDGTLLALVTLGTLLHPAVARAFAASPRRGGHAAEPAVAEGAADGVGDPAIG